MPRGRVHPQPVPLENTEDSEGAEMITEEDQPNTERWVSRTQTESDSENSSCTKEESENRCNLSSHSQITTDELLKKKQTDPTEFLKELKYLVMFTERKLELLKDLKKEAKSWHRKEKELLRLNKVAFQRRKILMDQDTQRKVKAELNMQEVEIEEGQKRTEKGLKLEKADLKACLQEYRKNLEEEEKQEKLRQKLLKEQQQKERIEQKKLQKKNDKIIQNMMAEERKKKKAEIMRLHKKEKREMKEMRKYEKRLKKEKKDLTMELKNEGERKKNIFSRATTKLFRPSFKKQLDKELKELEKAELLRLEKLHGEKDCMRREEEKMVKQRQEMEKVQENNRHLEERQKAQAIEQEAQAWSSRMRAVLSGLRHNTRHMEKQP